MSRPYFSLMLYVALFLSGAMVHGGEPKRSTTQGANQRAIRRAMNNFKKAPQPEVADQALAELQRLGISAEKVTQVLEWDRSLLDPDPSFRLKASKRLAAFPSPARLVAVGNLQRLVATESNPELLWQHAVTLSEIDPEAGSALERIRQTPFDPIMRNSLGLREFSKEERVTVQRDKGKQINKQEQLLRQFRIDSGDHLDQVLQETYEPPDTTIADERPKPYPPPPPQKIPAHPLIAAQRFDVILAMMDRGSDEAWELFRFHGDSFPLSQSAKFCIVRAYGPDWRERERALVAMWHAGEDAENAAALSYAIVHDLCLTHQVEMIDRVQHLGPYMEESLKRIRHHKSTRMRSAILRAMARTPAMEPLLFETLKQTLSSDELAMKLAAVQVIASLEGIQTPAHAWINDEFLNSNEPDLLAAIASALKNVSLPAEFQQNIVNRMKTEPSAEINLIFAQCLLDHVNDDAPAAKQLEKLQKLLVNLRYVQFQQTLRNELKVMIQQAKDTKKQTVLETIEQLDNLNQLLD